MNQTKIRTKIDERITLNCFAEGFPKPKVTWIKLSDSKFGDSNYDLLIELN